VGNRQSAIVKEGEGKKDQVKVFEVVRSQNLPL